MKTGLVLEGGAMRGMFTAGVIDVFMENGIDFDGMIGVSAGATFGCNFKSRQIGRTIRYNMKYCRDKRYCSLHSLFTTGNLYGADFCYRELPEELDLFDNDTYINNPMEFYLVCTDVETGKAVYRKCDSFDRENLEWIRASASMPLVSEFVEINGHKFLDGGVADSIPLKYFESIGYDRNVVVLTQPETYVKKKNSALPLIKIALRKYPKMVKALADRHIMYNDTVKYVCDKEAKGEVLVIRPDCDLPVGKIEKDPEKLKQTYEIGRRIATERLDEIKSFLRLTN